MLAPSALTVAVSERQLRADARRGGVSLRVVPFDPQVAPVELVQPGVRIWALWAAPVGPTDESPLPSDARVVWLDVDRTAALTAIARRAVQERTQRGGGPVLLVAAEEPLYRAEREFFEGQFSGADSALQIHHARFNGPTAQDLERILVEIGRPADYSTIVVLAGAATPGIVRLLGERLAGRAERPAVIGEFLVDEHGRAFRAALSAELAARPDAAGVTAGIPATAGIPDGWVALDFTAYWSAVRNAVRSHVDLPTHIPGRYYR